MRVQNTLKAMLCTNHLEFGKDKWLCEGMVQNLLDQLSNFRFKPRCAYEIPRDNLEVAQARMKDWYDKHTNSREFLPGDNVYVLLPLLESSLQARYSGPYLVQQKAGDRYYLVATLDWWRRTHLCHINMLKPYCACLRWSRGRWHCRDLCGAFRC